MCLREEFQLDQVKLLDYQFKVLLLTLTGKPSKCLKVYYEYPDVTKTFGHYLLNSGVKNSEMIQLD